ncbi:MAG: hypothetical protein ABWY02_02645 [Telluria sp.]
MAIRRLAWTTAVASCLLFTMNSAAPQARSSASISGFHYELVDLAPNDAVAPSISLAPTRILGESFLFLQTFTFPVSEASTNVFGAVSVENAFGRGSASLAPDYDARSVAEAQTYSARSGTLVDLAFVLSPNTRVIFSADAVASALPQNGFTFAEAALIGEITTPFISHGTSFSASVHANLGEEARLLSAVANADAVEAAGTLSIRSAAWAESFAAPIPEPRTSAMLLAGIMVLLARGSAERVKKTPGQGASSKTVR